VIDFNDLMTFLFNMAIDTTLVIFEYWLKVVISSTVITWFYGQMLFNNKKTTNFSVGVPRKSLP
jgi:hypothetical protein